MIIPISAVFAIAQFSPIQGICRDGSEQIYCRRVWDSYHLVFSHGAVVH